MHPDLSHTYQAVAHLPLELYIPLMLFVVTYIIVQRVRRRNAAKNRGRRS